MNKNLSVITDEPQIDFTHLTRIEYKGKLVLTTAQLAEFYDTNPVNLSMNFTNNKKYFVEGKHYFKLEGDELKAFKNSLKNFYAVDENSLKNFRAIGINAKSVLYLWTKRGAARHCKSVGTETAWNMFELLEDAYFSEPAKADKPIKNISDFERGKELARLARSARDPYIKNQLVVKAANLINGTKIFDELPEQLNLDFGA